MKMGELMALWMICLTGLAILFEKWIPAVILFCLFVMSLWGLYDN